MSGRTSMLAALVLLLPTAWSVDARSGARVHGGRALISPAPALQAQASSQVDPNQTVYVTRSGTKYHRSGCRSLSKSSIPMALKDAVTKYGPCSICKPPVLGTPAESPKGTTPPALVTAVPKAQPQSGEDVIVYVTRSGTKYHRAGCRSLAKSSTPISLKDAVAKGYGPCSICKPPTLSAATPAAAPAAPPSLSTTAPKIQPQGAGDVVVYVTSTGTKYHRAGCRSLAKSSIPMALKDAVAKGYGPCSICKPPALDKRNSKESP